MKNDEKLFLREYVELCEKHSLQIGGYGGDITVCNFKDDYYDLVKHINYDLKENEKYDFNERTQDMLEFIKSKL